MDLEEPRERLAGFEVVAPDSVDEVAGARLIGDLSAIVVTIAEGPEVDPAPLHVTPESPGGRQLCPTGEQPAAGRLGRRREFPIARLMVHQGSLAPQIGVDTGEPAMAGRGVIGIGIEIIGEGPAGGDLVMIRGDVDMQAEALATARYVALGAEPGKAVIGKNLFFAGPPDVAENLVEGAIAFNDEDHVANRRD